MDGRTTSFLEYEAHALLSRLARVKPFALQEAMVPAADIAPDAAYAIEQHLSSARRRIRRDTERFLFWLDGNQAASPEEAQRRFTLLRLRFGNTLNQFDMFSDVLTQRGGRDTGVWLRGLDVVAGDALALPGYYDMPPVVCYLDRGVGAAIRRARTRLPGGGRNPVAIIRVPRERLIGTGIASSLVHEVGHQAAALLELVKTLRVTLQARLTDGAIDPWKYWTRWISEIVADFWAIGRLGICSTLGLIGVVTLPRAFVFRVGPSDPHPFPWIRVNLSCAIGRLLYPHPQWNDLAQIWNSFYPRRDLPALQSDLLDSLIDTMPELATILATHQSSALRGRTLASVMELQHRHPAQLTARFAAWRADPAQMYREQPSVVFAALGQARADGNLDAIEESNLLAKLLIHWALHSTLATAERCAPFSVASVTVPLTSSLRT